MRTGCAVSRGPTGASKIHEKLSAVYGDNALKKTTLFKWIKRFIEDREDCKDDARPGRPSTSSVDEIVCVHDSNKTFEIEKIVCKNHRKIADT
ncbi:hypothetical protein ILUMI_16215 [Ignelater luminosus]|uniref:Mos1 transposase HTH domain-containing protein n=1 Tax=Ignelater luminosus TaxID=2038154 RepID=A0A8K0CTC7_IGNLU|nr:hypothetical protein ILUMI_16215 [Ignelater luminosus]